MIAQTRVSGKNIQPFRDPYRRCAGEASGKSVLEQG